MREALVTSWVDPKCNHEVPNERVRRTERRCYAAGVGEENFSSPLQFVCGASELTGEKAYHI